jgi:anthranilate synthase component 1
MHFQTRVLTGLLPVNLDGNPDITPFCKFNPDQYPYALVSTTQGAHPKDNDRYDILFAYPQNSITLDHNFSLENETDIDVSENSGFLDLLGQWWKSLSIKDDVKSLSQLLPESPFTGGWFVYLSYELSAEIEPGLNLPANNKMLPVAMAVRCPAAIIVDRQENKCFAVAENEYNYLLDQIEQDFLDVSKKLNAFHGAANTAIKIVAVNESSVEPYLKKIDYIKEYIRDGDIFQANLSRPWSITLSEDSCSIDDVDIFKRLSMSNPSSFSALIKTKHASIISSSPERLVRSKNNCVETRPIAGTRPRSTNNVTDGELSRELLANSKERAEHIMLIDLERNDLGRICIPGSINVNELMVLESYQHVHHIVSNVQGQLRENITPADIIKAVFPGGTITGCPKVRCMEILAEMEQTPRGAYTGSVGYINRDGSMDLNILIRTLVRQDNKISFRAGGGIVADSVPVSELEETRAKAKGLLSIFEKQDEPCSV